MRIPIIKIRQSWDRLVSTMGIAVITMKSFYWTQPNSWWRHQMETFSALLAFCEGNSPVTGEFPSQRPVARRFDVFFDMHPNKRLNKPSRHRWFETPSRTLWCHRNVTTLQPPTCSVQSHHPNQCWHITIKIQMTTFFYRKSKNILENVSCQFVQTAPLATLFKPQWATLNHQLTSTKDINRVSMVQRLIS